MVPVVTTREFMANTAAIGSIGASFYFVPETIATGKEHGLDGFRFYFLGRGGVLGDVEAPVVASAFGYFNPALVAKMWDSAKEKMAPRDAGRLYLSCAHALGRARLADVEGLEAYCAAADQIDAAIDPAAMALYAGIAAEPRPDDAPALAMHMSAVLREARGSAHLLAIRAAGVTPRLAHQIKRPTEGKLFGWEDDPPVSDDDRAAWDRAEEVTDELLEPAYARLDDDGRAAFLAGLGRIESALAG